MKRLILLLLIGFLSSFQIARAQNDSSYVPGKLVVIISHSGIEYVGKLVSSNEREVLIETVKLGRMYIPKYEIKEMIEIEERDLDRDGEYRSGEDFATRYFITTNGLPMGRKQSYVLWNLYGPDFQFGITEKFSAGLMTSWIGIPIIGTCKYSFELGSMVHFGVGVMAGLATWTDPSLGGGALPFASMTFGNKRSNLSITGGYGAVFVNSNTEGRFLISIAGMTKITKKVSLIFDTFIVPQQTNNLKSFSLIIPGLRWHTSSYRAFQMGFAGIAYDKQVVPAPIPMLGWFVKL